MSTTSGTDTDAGRDDAIARPTPASVRPAAPGIGAASDGPTGDPYVDEALTRLDGLADAPLREHVAAFDAVHGTLQDRLADAEGAGA
ncbi:hypothetical protein [Cellulomonas sp.]|uniref:hypothetical protein n=1 Tax=Cellulomonas sp. TaxID=40001 RepID=UPI001B051180|nr:hypothetical protein [Cellulomonas sp.]MBO9556678.1 hypothetical protein [Cellulomonas sp.]